MCNLIELLRLGLVGLLRYNLRIFVFEHPLKSLNRFVLCRILRFQPLIFFLDFLVLLFFEIHDFASLPQGQVSLNKCISVHTLIGKVFALVFSEFTVFHSFQQILSLLFRILLSNPCFESFLFCLFNTVFVDFDDLFCRDCSWLFLDLFLLALAYAVAVQSDFLVARFARLLTFPL